MEKALRFLIIDGYSKNSRDKLGEAGMQLAYDLYIKMLLKQLPDAQYDILLPSDEGTKMPDETMLSNYAAILWTGCDCSVNDTTNLSVNNQLKLARQAYEIGIPSFGSCWGLQISAVAAGGKVDVNPKGREMGIAHKIVLNSKGMSHAMYDGKPKVFEAFISHDDMVIEIPEGGEILAGNSFTDVQALSVTHKKGTFWSVQYHPEYNLNEMACLIIAREEKLTNMGYFTNHEDLVHLVERMKMLAQAPDRKDLRWQLSIDDDVLDADVKQCEFKNFIEKLVLPCSKKQL